MSKGLRELLLLVTLALLLASCDTIKPSTKQLKERSSCYGEVVYRTHDEHINIPPAKKRIVTPYPWQN